MRITGGGGRGQRIKKKDVHGKKGKMGRLGLMTRKHLTRDKKTVCLSFDERANKLWRNWQKHPWYEARNEKREMLEQAERWRIRNRKTVASRNEEVEKEEMVVNLGNVDMGGWVIGGVRTEDRGCVFWLHY
jgi:hypothetical protein